MQTPSVAGSPWIRGLITWLTYTLFGLASSTLAAPHTDVSQLYLAAGVALGLVMGWGPSMLWAVGLGGASVMLLAHGLNQTAALSWWQMTCLMLIGGIGAALQAWVGYRLTMGPKHQDLELDSPGQIARFLLLAGPVASITGVLVAVPGLIWLGVIPLGAVIPSALSWWAGDTMGTLVCTPIVLTLVGRPTELWRARRTVIGIPLAVSTVLLGLAIHQVQSWDVERETSYFERDVASTTNEVELKLNGYLHALEALHGVYEASDEVNRQEFATAARYWLSLLNGIQAVGWEERVPKSQLAAFEARQRAEGISQYRVFDRVANSMERRAPVGDEVIAIRFIEPTHGNERALGLNILSLDATRNAYQQALISNAPTATRGFQLTQEIGKQLGVVIYRPVFQPSASGRPNAPHTSIGTLFMTLRMDDTLQAMMHGLPTYLNVCLLEGPDGAPDKMSFLGGGEECRQKNWRPTTHLQRSVPLTFAGSQWHLLIWAKDAVPILGRGTTSWLLTVGGVTFVAALCTMLLVMSAHTRKVEVAMQEARERRLEAEAANRAKSEFLSRMSHELRTPLNAVLGFAQVMDIDTHSPLPPTQHQRLRQIQQAGWHLLDMIDDVLDIARLETGTLRLTTEPVALGPAIEQACSQVKDQAANLDISLSWPQDVPPDWGVQADPGRLRQILHTLLDNGITYNQRKGSVTVSVSRQQAADSSTSMVIMVKDTGMGMSPEQVAQLFQPFNRLGRDKQVPDGAGVGLAIGRHLATLMGGQLEAVSGDGSGSTFTLTLPAAPIEIAKITGVERDPGPVSVPPESPRHVLYVEDNLVNSEVVRAAFEDRPWIHLTVAPTIEQGLSVLHNRLEGPQPDLILLDVHLPDASGQEFLRLVKANPETQNIPVIMISADAMPEQIEAALSAGAACYLTKPVQLTSLLHQVDELLNRPAA